jgi:NAD(P)-dependent dehydrogenase (short-subunit alcohol dehydrogenase family)
MSVTGQVVVITGSAKGVGRYLARSFGGAGAKVVIADISPTETVAGELDRIGAEYVTIKTDVCDEESVASMVRQTWERYGRIDVLINDAGIVPHFSTGGPRWPRVRDMPRTQFQAVMDTNLVGTFLCCKHVLPYMESLKQGHVINFGQGVLRAGARPSEVGTAAYSTSKIAIRAFTRLVADEEREFGICIVSMGPGGIGPRREPGVGVPGAGGGIVHDDSPEWARTDGRPTIEAMGDRYLIAAEAPFEMTGQQVTVHDGALVVEPD